MKTVLISSINIINGKIGEGKNVQWLNAEC